MQKLLLLCALLATPALIHAQPAPEAAGHEETELDGKMDAMNGAFRKLRRQIADPAANASSLELVAKLRAGAEESVKLVPARAASVPEADRAKFTEAYAAKMQAFVDEVTKLEVALQAGKNEEAATILTKLGAMQKEGHREFRVQKKE